MTDQKERYIATLVGCAVGDALGMPVEGWKREQIKKYAGRITGLIDPFVVRNERGEEVLEDEFGKLKRWGSSLHRGEWTDDTILTLAIAESIIDKGGFDLMDVAKKQLNEYEKRQGSGSNYSGGFGGTTLKGFENLQKGVSPLESGVTGYPGNAPAMKMSPVGLYMDASGKYDAGLLFAEIIGKITHLDPRSVVSGAIQAHAVYSLLNNIKKEDFIPSLLGVCKKLEGPITDKLLWKSGGNIESKLEWIDENKDVSSDEAFENLGASSAVYRSYPFTLFMFQKHWDNALYGLIETVNYGGDCDTTGAIFGSLAGAKDGMIFPNAWLKDIKEIERIKSLGEKIYGLKVAKNGN